MKPTRERLFQFNNLIKFSRELTKDNNDSLSFDDNLLVNFIFYIFPQLVIFFSFSKFDFLFV